MTTRTYPKRCGKCGQRAMRLATVPYARTIEHDGRAYQVEIPAFTVPQCGNCQAISIDDEADHQISAAFRREAQLLAPEEIRQGREKLALTQKQFANLLGVGEVDGLALGDRRHRSNNGQWIGLSAFVSPARRR